MLLFKVVNKSAFLFYITLLVCFLISIIMIVVNPNDVVSAINIEEPDWSLILSDLFRVRNNCIMNKDFDTLQKLFLTAERNGRWAYELEMQRAQYLYDWAKKQGAQIIDISSEILIKSVKPVGRGYALYLISSDAYTYVYNSDTSETNMFRLGSYHSVDLIPDGGGGWIISREWYDDPLSDKLDGYKDSDAVTDFILSQERPDLSDLSADRLAAVEYADMFSGAASEGETQYQYNVDYTNFNAQGGDCANFASQILHEGGGFKKNRTWNYRNGKGSRAWVNAQGFKDYWLYSGNATLLASGKYENVYQTAYRLRPGDIVAYAKKGKVAHISVVTGLDSKGYPLVNCHNADRYRVPWDIGWSRSNITFYLISINY